MKVICIGDFHAANHKFAGGPMENGLNLRCQELIESCEYTVRLAIETQGVEAVVQVGDFFDQARPPAAVVDACIRMIQRTGVPWHIMAGNHDIASYDAPTAIAPLGHVPGIIVYEKPEMVWLGGIPWYFLPYTGPDAKAALDRAMKVWETYQFLSLPKVFCCHYGYSNKSQGGRADMFRPELAKWAGKSLWLFGHEHGSNSCTPYDSSGARLWSLGSFADYDFGDGCDVWHKSAIVDTDDLFKTMEWPNSGPVFMKPATFTDVMTPYETFSYATSVFRKALGVLYLRVRPEDEAEAAKLKGAGLIRDYVVEHGGPEEADSSTLQMEEMGYEARVADAVYGGVAVPEEDREEVYNLAISLGEQKGK